LLINIEGTSIGFASSRPGRGKMARMMKVMSRYVPVGGPTLEPLDDITLIRRFANTKMRYNLSSGNVDSVNLTIIP
jgi:hypothetical protein